MIDLPLTHASVTDSLVTLATHVVQHLGLAGVALLNCVSQLIIVPGTEATMLFAGFNVDQHHLTMVGIIVAGIFGDVLGGSIAYWIARFGLHEVLSHRGPIHISERRIEQAHGWFERWGSPVVAVSRCIPVLRSGPIYAAGIARMPFWRFVLMATLGSTVWIGGLAFIGKAVGSDWQNLRKHLSYIDYAVVAIVVVAIVWLAVRYIRGRRDRRDGQIELHPPGSEEFGAASQERSQA